MCLSEEEGGKHPSGRRGKSYQYLLLSGEREGNPPSSRRKGKERIHPILIFVFLSIGGREGERRPVL